MTPVPHKEIFARKKKLKMSDYKLAKNSGVRRDIIGKFKKDPNYKITGENLINICGALDFKLVLSEN